MSFITRASTDRMAVMISGGMIQETGIMIANALSFEICHLPSTEEL